MLDETTRVVNRLAIEVANLRHKEKEDVARATRDKTFLAEHYWQPRWHAEQKLKTARALLGVLIEDRYG